ATRLPRSAVALPKVLAGHRGTVEEFWRASVLRPPADAGEARARFAAAAARFEAVMRPHTLAAMLAQGIYEQVSKLAVAAGRPGLETRLMTGFGGFEETRLMRELWAVSRGRRALDDFLRAHGYHGPTEGEISSRSWREAAAPVAQLVETYRSMAESAGPAAVETARVAERERATAELLAALPVAKRAPARLVLRLARRY